MHPRCRRDEEIRLTEGDALFAAPRHHAAPFQDHVLVEGKNAPIEPPPRCVIKPGVEFRTKHGVCPPAECGPPTLAPMPPTAPDADLTSSPARCAAHGPHHGDADGDHHVVDGPPLPARTSRTTSATSLLLRCSNSISDGVNIRGAGEVPSFRLSKAVEGVTELVPPPQLKVRSALFSELMQLFR